MEHQKREFTGVWIPRHIIEDSRLNWTDRAIYAEIACYDQCFMSNAYLATLIGIHERKIQESISHLKKCGYVEQTGFDGRKRYLKAVVGEQTRRKGRGRHAENGTSATPKTAPIDNNIENTLSGETKVSQGEYEIVKDDDKPKQSKPQPHCLDVFRLFRANYPRNWQINRTERAAAENLYHERGPAQIQSALEFYRENKDHRFCPQILKPSDLDRKWSDLFAFKEKHYGN